MGSYLGRLIENFTGCSYLHLYVNSLGLYRNNGLDELMPKMSSLEQQWILTSVFKVYKPSEDATKSTTECVGVKHPLIVEEHEASFLCELV